MRHDRAFRAPGSEELYTTGTHFCIGPPFGCNTLVSNPDLKPESSANTELLARARFEQIFANDQLQINASVFQNTVDNFIEQRVTAPSVTPNPYGPPSFSAGTTRWRNVNEAQIEGFEISAEYRLDQLRLQLAYGELRGEDKKTGRDLSNIPSDTFTADLSYAFLDQQLTVGGRLINAASQSRTPDGKTYAGYTTADLHATWRPQWSPAIEVALALNNVTDKHYRRAFEELFESGRELIVSMRYDF